MENNKFYVNNDLCKRLKLRSLSQEALNHRLEVRDCIHEALFDYDVEDGFNACLEDVEIICQHLIEGELSKAEDHNEYLTKEVLEEAVAGGTFVACANFC